MAQLGMETRNNDSCLLDIKHIKLWAKFYRI